MRSPDQFSEALPDEIVYHQHLETGPNQIIPDPIPYHSLPIQAFKPDQLKSVRPPEQTTFPAVHQLPWRLHSTPSLQTEC